MTVPKLPVTKVNIHLIVPNLFAKVWCPEQHGFAPTLQSERNTQYIEKAPRETYDDQLFVYPLQAVFREWGFLPMDAITRSWNEKRKSIILTYAKLNPGGTYVGVAQLGLAATFVEDILQKHTFEVRIYENNQDEEVEVGIRLTYPTGLSLVSKAITKHYHTMTMVCPGEFEYASV